MSRLSGSQGARLKRLTTIASMTSDAAALTRELQVSVGVTEGGSAFKVLGYTASTPDGVRRLVGRIRSSQSGSIDKAELIQGKK